MLGEEVLVFTCAEAKGLEFNDVLIWRFFEDSINKDSAEDWLYVYDDFLKKVVNDAYDQEFADINARGFSASETSSKIKKLHSVRKEFD